MGGVDSRDGAAIVVVILFVCCFFTSVRTGSEVGFLGRLSDFGAEWVTWDDNLSAARFAASTSFCCFKKRSLASLRRAACGFIFI